METPAPSLAELKSRAEGIQGDDDWNDRVFNSGKYSRAFIPEGLFQFALDLIYGGHEKLGREFIETAWTPKYPLDRELLAECDALLAKSPYWQVIKEQRRSGKNVEAQTTGLTQKTGAE